MNTIKNETRTASKLLASCLATAMALSTVTFFSSSAASTPILNVKSRTIQAEDMAESRTTSIDISISDNMGGFLAGSFGIRYDERLTFQKYDKLSNAGEAFDVTCNPQEHILWFTGAAGSTSASASALQDEAIVSLYFDIPESINGGDFPLEFVWNGLDGSPSYWYTDKNVNVIEEVISSANNGKISFYNPESEAMNYESVRLNPDGQQQLEVLNASGTVFWFSSDTDVATVTESGLVEAVSPGECDIQAFINEHILSCHVTVTEAYYYSIAESGSLKITDRNRIIILEYPDAIGAVEWITANPEIATIDSDGVLHPIKNGKVAVFANYNQKAYMRMIDINFEPETEPVTQEPETTVAPVQFLSGDADGSGVIDILDVIMVNKAVLGKVELTSEQFEAADLNDDGVIAPIDALNILKKVVQLTD